MFQTMMILSGILLSGSVLAATLEETVSDRHFFLGISAGPTWVSGNRTQTLTLQSDIQKTYTADNSRIVFPDAEIFMGWQKPLTTTLLGHPLTSQLGMAVAAAGNAELNGDILEDSNPDFNNYNYSYKVQHTHAAIKGRLFAGASSSLQPYISGSVGVGFNRAYDFTASPKISSEVAAPDFRSNTLTALVYTLGIGLQKTLNPHVEIAIGYEFADWGKVRLSPATGQTTNEALSLSHLYAQQVQLALFYIF